MRPSYHYDTHRETDRSHWPAVRQLMEQLWPVGRSDLKVRVVVSMISLILAKILGVMIPVIYKLIVDALSVENQPIFFPVALVVGYGSAKIMQSLFGELRDLIFVNVSQHARRCVALKTFQHLHALSMAFHLERQTGGLSRIIERGTRGIQFILSFMLFNIIPILLELLLIAIMMTIYFDWKFACITIVTVVLYVASTMLITEWRLKFRREMNQKDTHANTKAIDSLINYETVKYFGNEHHEFQRFDRSLASYEKAAVRSQQSLALLNMCQSLIIGGGSVAIMGLAIIEIQDGVLGLGDFVMANTYMLQLFLPLNFLGFVYREMKQSLIDMDKMFELNEVQSNVIDAEEAVPLMITNGKIEFDRVTFGYSEDRIILNNLSFVVPPGKTVAIVGPSGSGKSTISRLLFRFYDPQKGGIRIDGQDLQRVTQESVRRAIGVVPQDTVLFNDSIGYNVQYGNPLADESKLNEAAKLARIDQFISSLTKGWDTLVGERGLKLSGGEKQRVAIARAILKAPPILVFDEATSALDSQTEKEIQKSLMELAVNRTTIIIAHRLSTIIDADEILVFKEGCIIERGNHDQLLRCSGEYARMWKRQQEAQEYQHRLTTCLEDV